MDCLDGKDTLGHVEFGNVFRERIVLDQPNYQLDGLDQVSSAERYLHGHEISTGQELHNQIEVLRILERVEKLNHPSRV